MSISNSFVSSKHFDKRDNFDFNPVNFLFFGLLHLMVFIHLKILGLLGSVVMCHTFMLKVQ